MSNQKDYPCDSCEKKDKCMSFVYGCNELEEWLIENVRKKL